jgi:hypothetical protein
MADCPLSTSPGGSWPILPQLVGYERQKWRIAIAEREMTIPLYYYEDEPCSKVDILVTTNWFVSDHLGTKNNSAH